MKNMRDLSKQYDGFANTYSKSINTKNSINRLTFYQSMKFEFKNKKLLDLGCGDGQDLKEYGKRGAKCYGIDTSKKLLEMARKAHPTIELTLGKMLDLPYKNSTFDIVLSKYSMGTVENPDLIMNYPAASCPLGLPRRGIRHVVSMFRIIDSVYEVVYSV